MRAQITHITHITRCDQFDAMEGWYSLPIECSFRRSFGRPSAWQRPLWAAWESPPGADAPDLVFRQFDFVAPYGYEFQAWGGGFLVPNQWCDVFHAHDHSSELEVSCGSKKSQRRLAWQTYV